MKTGKLLACATSALACLTATYADINVKIDAGKKFQKMEYFTASDAWGGQYAATYWKDNLKEKIAEYLFSQEFDEAGNPKGIGLSLWRVNLGGGTTEQENIKWHFECRKADSFLTPDGKNYDWSKCAGVQYLMKKARDYGCNNFLLFSNTPPIQFTKNGCGYADDNTCVSNLKPDCYGKFADYLADVAKHFQEQGYNISYISPINEPQMFWYYKNNQEGTPWTNSEMKKCIVALDKAMSDKGLKDAKILVNESADLRMIFPEFKSDWYGQMWDKRNLSEAERPQNQLWNFFDKSSPNYIGNLKNLAPQIAAHSYHTHHNNNILVDTRKRVNELAKQYGVEFHQTEWAMLPWYATPHNKDFTKDYIGENFADIQIALHMAKIIYADIVYGNSHSWGYWKAVGINNGSYGLIGGFYNLEKNNQREGYLVQPNKTLWALGNYSRFVRPDFTRIALDGADDLNGAFGSAYISPDGKQIVAVFVNMSHEFKTAKISFGGFTPTSVKAYTTDSRRDLAVENTASPDKATLNPRSITTVVFSK